MTQLTDEQIRLYKLIDEILWNDWDPIGVNDIPEARDEYQSYIPAIFSLVIKEASEAEIAGKLYQIEVERMGLPGNKENCLRVARGIKAV